MRRQDRRPAWCLTLSVLRRCVLRRSESLRAAAGASLGKLSLDVTTSIRESSSLIRQIAGGQPGDCFSALQIRPLDRGRGRGKEPELDPTLGTVRDAVETKVTFGFAPMRAGRRVVTALTVEQATAAVVAVDGLLLQAENRPARHHAEQRTQRTDRPAPKTRDPGS